MVRGPWAERSGFPCADSEPSGWGAKDDEPHFAFTDDAEADGSRVVVDANVDESLVGHEDVDELA